MNLPTTMQALALRPGPHADKATPSSMLELVTKPIPELRSGEILVKMEGASANPSDMLSMRGGYSFQRAPGEVCGIEGCGRVVAANAGLLGMALKGRRVAVGNQGGDGVWAEYARIEAKYVIPVGQLAIEAASAFIVNPFTSYALMERARNIGASILVQNAGASQVARGTIALGKARGLQTLSLVRRESQVAEVTELGGEAIVQDKDGRYLEQLRARLAKERRAAFVDAVCDVTSAEVMRTLPKGSLTIVLGFLGLAEDGLGRFPASEFVFRSQKLEPYWLTPWFEALGPARALLAAREVKKLFETKVFATRTSRTSTLAEFPAALDEYERDPSKGKVLLRLGAP